MRCDRAHVASTFQLQHLCAPLCCPPAACIDAHSCCSIWSINACRSSLCACRCTATAVVCCIGRVWVREAPPAQGPPADPALTPGSSRWARGVLASGGGAAGARAHLEHDAAPASAPALPPNSGGAAAAAAVGRSGGEQRLLMEGPGYAVRTSTMLHGSQAWVWALAHLKMRARACTAATLSCPGESIYSPTLHLMTKSAVRACKGTGLQREYLTISGADVPLPQFAYRQHTSRMRPL